MKISKKPDWAIRAIERMKVQKITHTKLGEVLGVTQSAVSHYLNGRRDPTLKQLDMIANTLKISPAQLVYGVYPRVRRTKKAIPLRFGE